MYPDYSFTEHGIFAQIRDDRDFCDKTHTWRLYRRLADLSMLLYQRGAMSHSFMIYCREKRDYHGRKWGLKRAQNLSSEHMGEHRWAARTPKARWGTPVLTDIDCVACPDGVFILWTHA